MAENPWDKDPVVDNLTAMRHIAESHGARVTSTLRDSTKQKELYDKYVAYRQGRGPWAALAAPPGSSAHESKQAIDVARGSDIAGIVAAANAAGIRTKKPINEGSHTHIGFVGNGNPWDTDPVVEDAGAAPDEAPWEADPVHAEAPVAAAPVAPNAPAAAPEQPGSFTDELGRALHRTVGMAAGGIGDTFGLVSNPLNTLINDVAGTNLGTDLGESARQLVGAPAPRNATERITDEIGQGMVGGGAFAKGAGLLGELASSTSVTNALKMLADTPLLDTLSGGSSAGSVQVADELGIKNPFARIAIGILGGAAPFGARAAFRESAPVVPEPGFSPTPRASPAFEGNVEVSLPQADDALKGATADQASELDNYFANVPRDANDSPVMTFEEWADQGHAVAPSAPEPVLPSKPVINPKTPANDRELPSAAPNDNETLPDLLRSDNPEAAAAAERFAKGPVEGEHYRGNDPFEEASLKQARDAEAEVARLDAERKAYNERYPPVASIDPEAEYQAQTIARGGGNTPPPPPPPGRGGPPELPPEPPKKGYAGNINLDRINGSDDLKGLIDDLSKEMPTNADRHQGHEATQELAASLGMTPEKLIAHNPKLTEAPQYALALRNTLKAAGDRFFEVARKVAEGDQRPETMRDLLLGQARMAAVMERTMEVTGVGGRLLDSFRIHAKGGMPYEKLLKTIPNDLWSNPEHAVRFAKLVTEKANNPKAVSRLMRDSMKPRAADYIFSAWYNWGLLSGIKTQAANLFSNTSVNLLDLATHGLASGIGVVRNGVSKTGDRVLGTELLARVYGTKAAMSQVGPNMKIAFREGAPLDQVLRMERPHVYGHQRNAKGEATPSAGAIAAELPSRMMAAQDEFFRTVSSLQELHGLAVRNASKEGLTGEALAKRAEELSNEPTDDMIKAAHQAGLVKRFQDAPSWIGARVEGGRSVKPGDDLTVRSMKNALRLFIPFVRTTDSLIRTSIRHSPFGVLDRYNLADWKAGGARRDLAIARVAMGSTLTMYALSKAMDGDITGEGPVNPSKRAQMMATGWRPNSVRDAEGNYVNIKGYEPLSTNFTAVATLVEQAKADELDFTKTPVGTVRALTLDLARIFNDNSWGESLTDLLGMVDPRMGDVKADNTGAGLVSSLTTPAIVRQVNQDYIDPVKRDTRGDGSTEGRIKGRVMAGWPGLSDNLPASYDVYGREVKNPDAYGPDIASRLEASPPDPDPVSHEVERLSGDKVLVGPPGKALKINGTKRKLQPAEFQQYQKASGERIHAALKELMASREWAQMSDSDRVDEVKTVVREMRKTTREELFDGNDDNAEE